MGCHKETRLKQETEKLWQIWDNSKTLKKWNLDGDTRFFKDLFFDATNKDFEAGVEINFKDMKKFQYMVNDQIKMLEGKGANKLNNLLWVGYAKAIKNPIVKKFYYTLSDANNFKNKHTQHGLIKYQEIMKELKDALVLESGNTVKYKDLQRKIDVMEKEYVKQTVQEGVAAELNASDQFVKLMDFFEGEGRMFQDFTQRIAEGSDAGLKLKYRDEIALKQPYINSLNRAASKWSDIVKISRKQLDYGIDNLIDIINMKYGQKSKIAGNLVEKYREVKKKLAESEDQGYAPHYVLNMLKDVVEMRSKIDLKSEMSHEQLDNILLGYVNNVEKVSTSLSPRLKGRSTNSIPTEYFSRNPALYINQFVAETAKFNHTTYVDRAFLKGTKDLSEVIFKNPGDKTAEAAGMYNKYLESLYADTKGTEVQGASTADNLHRFLTSSEFISKLGFNTRSPVRNLSQSLFTWKWFGRKGWSEGIAESKAHEALYNVEFEKYGLKFYDLGTITEGAITQSDLVNFGINVKDGHITRSDQITIMDQMAKRGIDLAAKSGVMMKWAENVNRRLTFQAAFGQRMKQLKMQTRFSDFSDPQSLSKMGDLAGRYAARVTELLHYQYGKHGKSDLLKSKVGSVMFQFQHYALSTMNLQAQIAKDYKKAFKAGDYFGYEGQRLGREIGLAMITNAISIPLGINVTSYISSEILGRLAEFVRFITGDEEEMRDAFYGKGPLISQSVVAQ